MPRDAIILCSFKDAQLEKLTGNSTLSHEASEELSCPRLSATPIKCQEHCYLLIY